MLQQCGNISPLFMNRMNENIHIMQQYYFEYKLGHDQDVQSFIEF